MAGVVPDCAQVRGMLDRAGQLAKRDGPRQPLWRRIRARARRSRATRSASRATRDQSDPLAPPGRRCGCWPASAISFLFYSSRRTLMMLLLRPPAARFSYGVIAKAGGIERSAAIGPRQPLWRRILVRARGGAERRAPPAERPAIRATRWRRLGGGAAAGRRRQFLFCFIPRGEL